jgi:hypothetical protein
MTTHGGQATHLPKSDDLTPWSSDDAPQAADDSLRLGDAHAKAARRTGATDDRPAELR